MASGLLGKQLLSANVSTLLFTSASTPQTFNLRFCNQSSTPAKVRVAIGTGASAAAADYITYDTTLLPNGFLEETGIVCETNEKVWVTSSLANVSARAFGF